MKSRENNVWWRPKKIGSKKDDKWIGGLGMIGLREVKIGKTDCRWNQGQKNARNLELGKEDGGNESWNMKLKSSKFNG